jgi:PPOX class probable F420-dependent enzyme
VTDLTSADCRHRFGAAERVVLGTAGADGVPHLVPVTFALLRDGEDDVVVTAVDHKPKRTRRLRRLRNIAERPAVTLLADEYGPDWTSLWWVRADATAEVLEGDPRDERDRYRSAVEALAARYPQYRGRPPDGPVIRAVVRRWTGWAASGPATPHPAAPRPSTPPPSTLR